MSLDLMALLPPPYEDNVTMTELQSILSADVAEMIANIGAAIDECFAGTASGLLSRYESIYGIPTNVSLSDAFRREIIRAKLRGVGTVTRQLMIDTAASYSNGTVEVTEYPAESRFVVKFTGALGIPANIDGLTNTINEIKPAHLAFSYEYTYTTWAQLEGYNHTWAEWEAKNLTWAELEVYSE